MPSIYLVRHGQASFGQQNYDDLSDLGVKQAQVLGASLANRVGKFDQVVLGTMQRHAQTAQHSLSQMSEPVDVENWQRDAGWNEYDHQDILAQLGPEFETAKGIQAFVAKQDNPKAAFEKLFNDAINRWMSGDFDSEYVESWGHYQSRINQALSDVCQLYADAKSIAVFTSGGPISVVTQKLLGVAAHNIMDLNWTLVNCGVSKIVSSRSRTFVSSLNEHPHFEGQHRQLVSYK